jgi:hypothetical protein
MRRLGPDEGAAFDLNWFDKWSNADTFFTSNFFGDRCFPSRAAATVAWPRARRAIWARTPRFHVPAPARVFDGLTIDSCDAARDGWFERPYPLAAVLDALEGDRAHLAAFTARDPRGAADIGDFLALFAGDLVTIEATARDLGACPETLFGKCPHHLSTALRYDGSRGGGHHDHQGDAA